MGKLQEGDYVAQVYRGGDIAINPKKMRGAIPIAHGERGTLIEALRHVARFGYRRAEPAQYGYDGYLMLVPGIPEAEDYDEAQEALSTFSRAVELQLQMMQAV